MTNPYMKHDAEDGAYIEDAIKIGTAKNFIGAVSQKALDEASGGTENAIALFMSAFRPRDVSEITDNFCASEIDAKTELVGLLCNYRLCGLFNKKHEAALNEAVSELVNSNYCSSGWETVDDSTCRRIFSRMAEEGDIHQKAEAKYRVWSYGDTCYHGKNDLEDARRLEKEFLDDHIHAYITDAFGHVIDETFVEPSPAM